MLINTLLLKNFRNYKDLKLDLSPSLNIFTGDNAQGKTNIIESIYYAALGTSYRLKNDNDLIHWQEEKAAINICFSRIDIKNNIKFLLTRGKRKQIILNGGVIRQKDLPGTIMIVLFSPEDLMLIKGSPALRRRFLDIELSQTNIFYYTNLVKYNRVVTQRNNLLKKIREDRRLLNQLDMWDNQLIDSAVFIWKSRFTAIKKIAVYAAEMQQVISDNKEELKINYKINNINKYNVSDDLKTIFKNNLIKNKGIDIKRGTTSIGPHHDDLELEINSIDLKNFGSQGQQRTAVLALKLAELEYMKNISGQYPILLLDDVMSELDEKRREKMVKFFQNKNIQTFITGTDAVMFSKTAAVKLYNVSAGQVEVL
ncbi:DNA replication/repair protein RecF [Pectinatus frisingensis]|jgi:DNA replication and repair protein RecF|uniref:DNA replication/repair protein RecF n=1 Tax=Pectinatus frisingensis TaxID=865 RepID=UPI0015F5CA5A|nr:DNA replication/repair protein RecF [Pectinatus frisingensis]